MLRRSLFIGSAAALAAVPFSTLAAHAQASAVDDSKLPALMGGDFATASSQLALEKSRNGAITTFAQLEVAEQAAVATAFGSKPGAAGVREDHAAMLAQLEALDGAEFDVMYVQGQIAGHEELLAIHQDYATSGEDPMARGASIVGVTGIQTHLAMLRAIQQSLGA